MNKMNETFQSYNDNFPLLMPKWGYVTSAFVLFIIGFFGFFLNLMVILLIIKDKQLWTPLNIILFNLVCSDFCVSILGNPLTLISALFHRWMFGKIMCMVYGFLMALFGITSITTLTVLSFQRYLLVTRPISSQHFGSKEACFVIIFIWTYSLALTTPPLMGWGKYVNEAANISCSVNWHEQSTNALTYILFLFAMGQIIPFGVISFSYINIVRAIKKNSQRMGRVGKAESKVTSMVFVMIIAFVVAWTPYSVFALMEQFGNTRMISPGVGVIPALVAKSSICYDPIIYIGMNTQFRQSIKRLFGDHSNRKSTQTKRADSGLTSPSHKYLRVKNIARGSCSTTNISTVTKKPMGIDNVTCLPVNKVDTEIQIRNDFELITIHEKNTNSDKSGETIYEDDSVNDTHIEPLDLNQQSIEMESERLLFKNNKSSPGNKSKNVFVNNGFQSARTFDHDVAVNINNSNEKKSRFIKQSYSFELDSTAHKLTSEKVFEM